MLDMSTLGDSLIWEITPMTGQDKYPLFQASHLPKPSSASPHSFEVVFGARGCAVGYSFIYDGSKITDDDRDVDRNTFIFTRGIGVFYHYYNLFSIRFTF